MERIEWQIKNQNAKYKVTENLSKESSINISKEKYKNRIKINSFFCCGVL
jgi:hypothetical protein